ncbi:uncharacterized protein LOC141760288 [Sebastes fasciatus]|uniref:uncharacterized protein LOC141760288 n=1 Tax=Sebastes fasciatus TaxID=394691 RepID=UPI003D9F7675
MSRIISVALLLIVLVDTFYDSSAASHAGFHVSKVHIRECRCRVFPSGKIKCRYPLFPKNHVEKQNLIKCFCSKTNQHKFPEFKTACSTWRPDFPISLV